MFKRVLSVLLATSLVVTQVPMDVLAETRSSAEGDSSAESQQPDSEDAVLYGDVNGDGRVDLKDVLMLKRYTQNGEKQDDFVDANADANGDGIVNAVDLDFIKGYVAEERGNKLSEKLVTVEFYDGDRRIDSLTAVKGKPLGSVPSAEKSSKKQAILVGYFRDKDFQEPFYAEDPVTGDMKVYAKYDELPDAEALNQTSFTQMDQSPDLSFDIVRASGDIAPENAATLKAKDSPESVEITVTDEDGDGTYTVKAPTGFREGCSYELTLADGWYFKGQADTVRTASFTIAMKEVENLQMSEDIKYVKDTDAISYTILSVDSDNDGTPDQNKTYDVLTPALVSSYGSGTFTYSDSAYPLETDDIVCFYLNTKPTDRTYSDDTKNYNDDPEVYVKVESVSGTTVTYSALGDEDMNRLYEVPDNFPLQVEEMPALTAASGTVAISRLDTALYAQMVVQEGETVSSDTEALLAQAKAAINVGDFVSIYKELDQNSDNEGNVYYGKITAYDAETGSISYVRSSVTEIEESMNLYIKPELSGDDIVSEEAKQEIEEQVQAQIAESDFAEEAVMLLADLATKTDGFRKSVGVENYSIQAEDGHELSNDEIQLMNLGANFKLADDVELTVELITSGDQLHFKDKGSVQLAVGVKASIEVDAEDGKVMIDLSATFVEEMALGINVKGELVKKRILGIPIPKGVCVSANIDVYNYTAVDVNVNVYTEEAEEKGFLDKFKDICKDPIENLGDVVSPDLAKGLKTVGDALDKIDELQNKINEAKETAEQLRGYQEDIKKLWAVIDQDGKTSQEEMEELYETLGKTNVTKDLKDLMGLTTETGITSGKYAESLEDLLKKYSEMLEKETGWVELVNETMAENETCYYGIAINYAVNFVVRLDANVAMGTSIEYQVGKRYSFWFKVGLFKPKAGSSVMDLVDEQFAFQFYVMGKLGLKMGVEGTFKVGIGTTKFASVGVHLELGPYVKIWGFFIYEYERIREAGTSAWKTETNMAGALFIEFGVYIILGADANAIGNLFEWSKDFVDVEIPILKAGAENYPYKFTYESKEDEKNYIQDEDGDSSTGITMKLPDDWRAVTYINLTNGAFGQKSYDYDDYYITLSNKNFELKDGVITVTPPKGEQYMECDLTFTYKYGKLAFCDYDMSVTIPLVWTNLSDSEQNESYTASVRVGNAVDGYETVWSKKVKKNQSFDLPTLDEVKEQVNYSEYKYEYFDPNNSYQALAGEKIYEDKTYDIQAKKKTYSVTVTGIQNADGTATSKTYTAGFGETFDFDDLKTTGTDIPGVTYTKFDKLEAIEGLDLAQPIDASMADKLKDGSVSVAASYVDDSVTATFTFDGIEHDTVTQKVRKGTAPSLDLLSAAIDETLSNMGKEIKSVTPELGSISEDASYKVTCEEVPEDQKRTITFESNGGSSVDLIKKAVNSLISLPAPTREGYAFVGWYTDDTTFTNKFEAVRMPSENVTLYAKWTPKQYTVTFHVNGGNELSTEQKTKTVTYGNVYDVLPAPTRSGHGFAGWYTAAEGGEPVNTDTIVNITENQTLYAHWNLLKTIPTNVFDFGTKETPTYVKGITHEAAYTFTPEEDASYQKEEFKFQYKKQGESNYVEGLPDQAGTYDVLVQREADNTYTKFDYTYTAVLTINKATRTLSSDMVSVSRQGYSFAEVTVHTELIDDLSDQAKFEFSYSKGSVVTKQKKVILDKLLASTNNYSCSFIVKDDPNYVDTGALSFSFATMTAPTENWSSHRDTTFTVPTSKTEYVLINKAEQLAQLAYLVNTEGKDFSGHTFILGKDIDLTGYKWTPIGTASRPFKGIFDGNRQVIRGMYVNGSENLGLFGVVQKSGTNSTKLMGIRLSESYVKGVDRTGAIAGWIIGDNNTDKLPVTDCMVDTTSIISTDWGAGGIAGVSEAGVLFDRCVNDAYLNGVKEVGGIVGLSSDAANTINVRNCVNYGRIEATYNKKNNWTNGSGGIVGSLWQGNVINCANFGDIKGGATVGGVVGTNLQKTVNYIYNCYSAGSVSSSSNAYVAAVIGRNESGKGRVWQCYYLKDSAKAGNGTRKASGTKTGCDDDNITDIQCAYFTSPGSELIQEGKTVGKSSLIDTLNDWVTTNGSKETGMGSAEWTADGPDGYPIPKGIPTLSK